MYLTFHIFQQNTKYIWNQRNCSIASLCTFISVLLQIWHKWLNVSKRWFISTCTVNAWQTHAIFINFVSLCVWDMTQWVDYLLYQIWNFLHSSFGSYHLFYEEGERCGVFFKSFFSICAKTKWIASNLFSKKIVLSFPCT